MTDADPTTATRSLFTRILVLLLVVLAVVTAGGAIIGSAVAGPDGAISALIGGAVALVFCGLTVVSMIVATRVDPGAFLGVILGFWAGKFIVLFVAVLALRDLPFIVAPVLIGTTIVAAVASVVLDAVVVLRARIPVAATPSAPVSTPGATTSRDGAEDVAEH